MHVLGSIKAAQFHNKVKGLNTNLKTLYDAYQLTEQADLTHAWTQGVNKELCDNCDDTFDLTSGML